MAELEIDRRIDAINNAHGYGAEATMWRVDTPSLFKPELVVQVPRTGEYVVVKGITDEAIFVARGTSRRAALLDGDPIVIIGVTDKYEGPTLP